MADTTIIIASCTAPGAGALALLRLDGAGAALLVQKMARTRRVDAVSAAPTHTIVYGHVVDAAGKDIDQVLFLVMRAPRTFTGNEIVEITCHNNPFIIAAISARAAELGARPARPGEFTQRAVLNGKLDLIQAEALHDLIMAPSRVAAERSLAQLEGSLSRVVLQVQERLVELGAFIEASFEFSEEEHLDLDFDGILRTKIAQALSFVAQILEHQTAFQQLREGAKVALVGTVNAGKSTLLNALVGRNRAIVSDRPGTTRDSIEVGVTKGGYAWTYIDTAGLRETEDVIEQEGIMRTGEAAAGADVVLLVCDASVALTRSVRAEYEALLAAHAARACVVFTKVDKGLSERILLVPPAIPVFSVSAATGVGMHDLVAAIFARVQGLYESCQAPFLLNQRQRELLVAVEAGLLEVQRQCGQARPSYELVATAVHELIALTTELSGRSVTEQVMDAVFSTFCIGK